MLAAQAGNFHGGNGAMPSFWLVRGCGSGDYLLLVMVGQKVWSGEGGGVRTVIGMRESGRANFW